MGSLAEGGSYCEDQASTKALAGSVICPATHNNAETKSLCGAKSVCSGITSGAGDNASVRGLAGSICNGVEPAAPASSGGAVRCSKCHKPVHITLRVEEASNGREDCAGGDENWRKLSADSRQSALETRITKFVDQLSVDSYDIGAAGCVIPIADDDESDSNMLLGEKYVYRNAEKICVPTKKLESRHLSAINEVHHACSTTSAPVDEQDECLCDDGEVLLLQPESYSLVDQQGNLSSLNNSKISSSSWKFLKKSRSWSAKLDSTRSGQCSAEKCCSELHNNNNNNNNNKQQLPSVHYKKHSSSWKFKITKRTVSSSNSSNTAAGAAPCVVLTEPR